MGAAEFRRQMLLQEACRQWLTTSDSLAQVRASTAARYQTKSVMDSFQLVQRCVLHWKCWTQQRRGLGQRVSREKEPSSLTVLSRGRLPLSSIELQTIPTVGQKEASPWLDISRPPVHLITTDRWKENNYLKIYSSYFYKQTLNLTSEIQKTCDMKFLGKKLWVQFSVKISLLINNIF